MILDTMDRRGQYCESYPAVYRALEAMAGYTADNYPGGRVTVDGDALFLLLNQYTTRSPENAMAEAHRQYLDVMYMVEGSETIYVKPTDRLQTITKPYLDYYILDQAHRVSYLRKSRAISRMLSINWEHLGKARSYAGQLRTRLSNYGQY